MSVSSWPSALPYPDDLLLGPDPDRRPRPVTVAVALMAACSAFAVTVGALALLAMWHFTGTFPAAAALTGASDQMVHDTELWVRAALIVLSIGAVASSAVMALLAVGVQAGNRGARMGTWVLCALATPGAVVTLGVAVLSRTPVASGDPSTPTYLATALARAAQQSAPGWFSGAVGSLCALSVLGYIAVAVLLAVPRAKAYFHRLATPWPAAT